MIGGSGDIKAEQPAAPSYTKEVEKTASNFVKDYFTDEKVATIDKKGVISAKKPRRAIVTFTAMKG